jgi:uncharacterized protein with LGFP repeats
VSQRNDKTQSGRFSRRSLIVSSAGAATTVAVTVAAPAAALAMTQPDSPPTAIAPPATPMPADPVVAWVHDAARGEVTVLSGTVERTYRDPVLAKRLLAASDAQNPPARGVR